MNAKATQAAKTLCGEIKAKMDILDVEADDLTFLEWFDEPVDILAGAVIAQGFLQGDVEITETTLPYLEKTLKALTKAEKKVAG